MIKISKSWIDDLSAQARKKSRLRTNYNFHKTAEDTLHRMLNAMEPGTYVQPHKHENPDKREAFIILSGKVAVLSFNETGQVEDKAILAPGTENLGVEIPPGRYHSLISLESGTVLYEVKDGPYNVANDKTFASWAPAEDDPEAEAYLSRLTTLI